MLRKFWNWLTTDLVNRPVDGLSRRGFIGQILAGVTSFAVGPLLPAPLSKEQIISALLSTEEGRAKLAASMIQPLRTRLDYQSLGRKCFKVESLPNS